MNLPAEDIMKPTTLHTLREVNMGRGDNRKSAKMRRRQGQNKKKARQQKKRGTGKAAKKKKK